MLRRIFQKFVFKTYRTRGNPEAVRYGLTSHLLERGMVQTGVSESGAVVSFRYPSLLFSSKRPWTCLSELTVEARGNGGEVKVRIGASFVKIRNFTILLMGFIWMGLPTGLALLRGTFPDFSPFGVLVVPAGFLIHYSVRGRVFRYLRRAIENAGEHHGVR
jgi:hypothetical protein